MTIDSIETIASTETNQEIKPLNGAKKLNGFPTLNQKVDVRDAIDSLVRGPVQQAVMKMVQQWTQLPLVEKRKELFRSRSKSHLVFFVKNSCPWREPDTIEKMSHSDLVEILVSSHIDPFKHEFLKLSDPCSQNPF